jgi:benzaldehyde dehydrogenase (NAD)
VRTSCGAAQQAQPGWAVLPYAERAKVFRRAAELLEANRAEFSTWLVRETGGIPPKAMFEIDSVLHLCHEAAAMLTQPTGLVLPSASGVTSLARRVPHGVVGVISPFNFPFLLSSRAALPALAAGNAVVLKPDPRTPVSGGVLLALLLQGGGLPDGVFHMLPGEADAGEALVTDPAVTMISFTGSTAVGRRVGELAGRHLKKVALELGGKNALIVLDDADLGPRDRRRCVGLVAAPGPDLHERRPPSGAPACRRRVRRTHGGKGQRASGRQPAHPAGRPWPDHQRQAGGAHRSHRAGVCANGAQLLAGGTFNGPFYAATVLADVTPEMPAFREEIFGPVVSITPLRKRR